MPNAPAIALDATQLPSGAEAPEWLHLLPPPGVAFAHDRKGGPLSYDDAQALIAASFAQDGPRLFIDINHSTLRAGMKGEPAPAIGEVTEMEAREDGIWGRVAWSSEGARLMADRAYRAVSPVLLSEDGSVTHIWHVSVTNNPALRGLITSLTKEEPKMEYGKIAKALGLAEDASEDAILAAIAKMMEASEPVEMTALCAALGAEPGASEAELVVLAKSAKAAAQAAPSVTQLQAQIAELTSERWVDAKIAEGAGIGPEIRADIIALHAESPDRAARMVAQLPALQETHARTTPPAGGGAVTALTDEQTAIADQLGLTADQRAAMLDALKEEF